MSRARMLVPAGRAMKIMYPSNTVIGGAIGLALILLAVVLALRAC